MNTIEKAIEKYYEIQTILLANEFAVSNYKEINYGLQFPIRNSNWCGIVRVYQNKQGKVKTDLSQLDESSQSHFVKGLIEDLSTGITGTVKSVLHNDLILPIMGSDESGKGDYFGSLVSACIYVDEKIANQLSTLGVKDSKVLSDNKIKEIAREIRKCLPNKFIIIEIPPEKYNQIYARFEKDQKSLNDLLAWAHAKAIEELLLKVECKTVIVDQFANENILLKSLQERGKQLKVIQAHRAESHIAVAAASILARDRFVSKLEKLGKQYQVKLPKGASTAVIEMARYLVEKHGIEILEKIAKLHFKTTKDL
jgi:ribonuclease HIII